MNELPTIKIFKVDYSFLIRNYLNPELWKKEWTLFAYKNIECTLQIYSIQTIDEKIRFQIRCYSHNLESTDFNNYCTNYIDCSLKIEDITFLKRQINSCIFNTMVSLERIYYIRRTKEYKDMEERRYEERYRLKQYANEFLNECGVTSDACREAYVDAYVEENERMYDLMGEWEDEQIYRHLTGMYLTFLDTLENDPKKEIRTKEIQNKLSSEELQDIQDEIKDFVIFMEDEENFEKELKSKLEEV